MEDWNVGVLEPFRSLYTVLRVSFERQNVEPGMSNHEVETFEIRYSWFVILPFVFSTSGIGRGRARHREDFSLCAEKKLTSASNANKQ